MPEPTLPARTPFSSVTVSGPVKDGIFRSDNLRGELPFMQLTGKGSVNLPAATIDYNMTARVLERPEFVQDATPVELDEFTEAVIPLRISGPLAAPSVKPDLEKMLKKEVRKKAKERLLDKLLGGRDAKEEPAEGEVAQPAEGATEQPAEGEAVQPPEGEAEQPAEGEADQPPEEEADDKDKLKDALKDLIGR